MTSNSRNVVNRLARRNNRENRTIQRVQATNVHDALRPNERSIADEMREYRRNQRAMRQQQNRNVRSVPATSRPPVNPAMVPLPLDQDQWDADMEEIYLNAMGDIV